MLKLAFAGFRHSHIMSLYQAAAGRTDVRIVAACEEDAAAAAQIKEKGEVRLTHDSIAQMLRSADCDAVAIGDYYGRRGGIALAALEAGKHVIADKPLCTSLKELDAIEALAARRRLRVGCLLDLRGNGGIRAARELIAAGKIGAVHTINVTAQHPLMPDKRPGWYFEPGKHGGTFNDIAIHAIDLIPWLTGRRIVEVVAARAWNARLPQHPHFQDAAQFMLRLDNGGGVLGDFSYLAPNTCGFAAPQYWRFSIHGSGGVTEITGVNGNVIYATHQDTTFQTLPRGENYPQVPLDDFLADLSGQSSAGALTTASVFYASRQALMIQQAADESRGCVPLA